MCGHTSISLIILKTENITKITKTPSPHHLFPEKAFRTLVAVLANRMREKTLSNATFQGVILCKAGSFAKGPRRFSQPNATSALRHKAHYVVWGCAICRSTNSLQKQGKTAHSKPGARPGERGTERAAGSSRAGRAAGTRQRGVPPASGAGAQCAV